MYLCIGALVRVIDVRPKGVSCLQSLVLMKEELPLRLPTYIPLSLSGADRFQDVLHEWRNFDIVGFPGTQRHRGQEAIERVCINGRVMIEPGWKSARETNKSAGCGLLLGRRFKERHVVRT